MLAMPLSTAGKDGTRVQHMGYCSVDTWTLSGIETTNLFHQRL